MESLFDDLKTGLQQAIDYEAGKGHARTSKYTISPVKRYEGGEIRTVRMNAGMTQTTFAEYMGVSKKTVEAWERGRTRPTGPACRLIEMLTNGSAMKINLIRSR